MTPSRNYRLPCTRIAFVENNFRCVEADSPTIARTPIQPRALFASERPAISYTASDLRAAPASPRSASLPPLWRPRFERERVAERRETEFRDEAERQLNPPINGWEFAAEMLLGLPRGVRQMGMDARDNPLVVGGTIGSIIVLTKVLPTPWSRWFSRGLLGVGVAVGGGFAATGIYRGIRAYQRHDRTALREASTLFGVGLTSLALTYGGVRLGKYLETSPRFSRYFAPGGDTAVKTAVFGSLLHSTDEIAAVLAIVNSARDGARVVPAP